MRNLFYISLILISLTSCREKTVAPGECRFKAISGNSGSVVGKWKVVHLEYGYMSEEGPTSVDLTCSNVFFEFSKSGVVRISSDDERFIRRSGEFEYEIRKSNKSISEIKIGSLIWPSIVTKNELILDLSPLDGSKIRMYRIK